MNEAIFEIEYHWKCRNLVNIKFVGLFNRRKIMKKMESPLRCSVSHETAGGSLFPATTKLATPIG